MVKLLDIKINYKHRLQSETTVPNMVQHGQYVSETRAFLATLTLTTPKDEGGCRGCRTL